MGQKVHPRGFRIGITEDWRSNWYANKKEFGTLLVEDRNIREHIKKNYRFAGIPVVQIERTREEARITLHTARPGLIIGRKGAGIDKLTDELESLAGRKVTVKIKEVNKPELDAQLVAEAVGEQLERRAAFRRTLRKALDVTMNAGAEGCRVQIAGRLAGAEIARTESVSNGKIPLHTLRANIDYGFHVAVTTYGTIGVKVWIYKGNFAPGEKRRYAYDAKESQV
ncbi:MAG: 30S ribosomal protein S3 [Candidatus Brocadiales bacterium]|nr:30S ribosomal protein S3 [Candidatus Bathyanammoxibius sp.]MCQ4574957.1 30S ribosomal protein S3 [Candidatus Bathyanammoxibius amoris]